MGLVRPGVSGGVLGAVAVWRDTLCSHSLWYQGLLCKDQGSSSSGSMFWAFGGDVVPADSHAVQSSLAAKGIEGYGLTPLPHDNNFCCNGLLTPDRVPHPAAWEFQRLQQV